MMAKDTSGRIRSIIKSAAAKLSAAKKECILLKLPLNFVTVMPVRQSEYLVGGGRQSIRG